MHKPASCSVLRCNSQRLCQALSISLLYKLAYNKSKPLYLCTLDFTRALDSVDVDIARNILLSRGVPPKHFSVVLRGRDMDLTQQARCSFVCPFAELFETRLWRSLRNQVSNSDILSLCQVCCMESQLRSQRLRWNGHNCGMSDKRVPNIMLFGHHLHLYCKCICLSMTAALQAVSDLCIWKIMGVAPNTWKDDFYKAHIDMQVNSASYIHYFEPVTVTSSHMSICSPFTKTKLVKFSMFVLSCLPRRVTVVAFVLWRCQRTHPSNLCPWFVRAMPAVINTCNIVLTGIFALFSMAHFPRVSCQGCIFWSCVTTACPSFDMVSEMGFTLTLFGIIPLLIVCCCCSFSCWRALQPCMGGWDRLWTVPKVLGQRRVWSCMVRGLLRTTNLVTCFPQTASTTCLAKLVPTPLVLTRAYLLLASAVSRSAVSYPIFASISRRPHVSPQVMHLYRQLILAWVAVVQLVPTTLWSSVANRESLKVKWAAVADDPWCYWSLEFLSLILD